MTNVVEPTIAAWERQKQRNEIKTKCSIERANIIVQQVFDSQVELACNGLSHAEKLLRATLQHDKTVLNEALVEYDIYKLVELLTKIERKGAL